MADIEEDSTSNIVVNGTPVTELKITDIKHELEIRGLSKSGSRPQLAERLKAQLLLEKLQQDAAQSSGDETTEGKVPNMAMKDDKAGQSDFVRQYLQQQQRNIEIQMEVKKQVEEERKRKSADESSADELSTTQEEKITPAEAEVSPSKKLKVDESSEETKETLKMPRAARKSSRTASKGENGQEKDISKESSRSPSPESIRERTRSSSSSSDYSPAKKTRSARGKSKRGRSSRRGRKPLKKSVKESESHSPNSSIDEVAPEVKRRNTSAARSPSGSLSPPVRRSNRRSSAVIVPVAVNDEKAKTEDLVDKSETKYEEERKIIVDSNLQDKVLTEDVSKKSSHEKSVGSRLARWKSSKEKSTNPDVNPTAISQNKLAAEEKVTVCENLPTPADTAHESLTTKEETPIAGDVGSTENPPKPSSGNKSRSSSSSSSRTRSPTPQRNVVKKRSPSPKRDVKSRSSSPQRSVVKHRSRSSSSSSSPHPDVDQKLTDTQAKKTEGANSSPKNPESELQNSAARRAVDKGDEMASVEVNEKDPSTAVEATEPVIQKPDENDADSTAKMDKEKVVKKRKWGSKTSKATKTPKRTSSIEISSDSLKGLIGEVKLAETVFDMETEEMNTLDYEPEQEDKRDVKIKRTAVDTKPMDESIPEKVVIDDDDDRTVETVEKPEIKQQDETRKISISSAPVKEGIKKKKLKEKKTENKKSTVAEDKKEKKVATKRAVKPITMEVDEPQPSKSVSPALHPRSRVIRVTGLVRPFTLGQLKELLKRTGELDEKHFWINSIKSHCLVTYKTEEEAEQTRVALHGTKWPSSNPKTLVLDFSSIKDVEERMAMNDQSTPVSAVPVKRKEPEEPVRTKTTEFKENRQERDGERPRRDREPRDQREKERSRKLDEKRKNPPIREWDRDKIQQRSRSRTASREKDRRSGKRSASRDQEHRKREDGRDRGRKDEDRKGNKKLKESKDEEPPAKLLDDLFKKTKATPCIYWLPLTEEQSQRRAEQRKERQKEREKRLAAIEERNKEEEKKREAARQERMREREKEQKERERERNRRERKRSSTSRSRSRSRRRK